jgi:hypothetical protein
MTGTFRTSPTAHRSPRSDEARAQSVGVPLGYLLRAEVVSLVAAGGQVRPAEDAAVVGEVRVDVDDGERIGRLPGPVEGDE